MSDGLGDYVAGAAAARLFGVSRADSVWRAIARHGDDYPGRIEVVAVGRTKAARRDELAAFTEWFGATYGGRDNRLRVGAAEPVEPAALRPLPSMDERRALLRRAIEHLTGV
jgi:hypothetical protein